MLSAICFNLDESKILLSGNGIEEDQAVQNLQSYPYCTVHNPDFKRLRNKKPFENNVGKGENSENQLFLLFPQSFLFLPKTNSNFLVLFILSSAKTLNLVERQNWV